MVTCWLSVRSCLRYLLPPNALVTFAFEGDLAPRMCSVLLSVKSTVNDLQKEFVNEILLRI